MGKPAGSCKSGAWVLRNGMLSPHIHFFYLKAKIMLWILTYCSHHPEFYHQLANPSSFCITCKCYKQSQCSISKTLNTLAPGTEPCETLFDAKSLMDILGIHLPEINSIQLNIVHCVSNEDSREKTYQMFYWNWAMLYLWHLQ